jgi:endonuclease/exonuclease/phosphatase family metal-dependent hydrolase
MNGSLRVATFNTKRLGRGQHARAEVIAEHLVRLTPDLVALQEVDDAAAAHVALRAGFSQCTFVGHSPNGRRGVALLHRDEAITRDGAKVPARWRDDKGYARIVLKLAGRELEVVALHLDWASRRARGDQLRRMAELLPPRAARIVLGDLNAMNVGAILRRRIVDDTVAEVSRALAVAPPPELVPTFPARAPRWALDAVLASAPLAVTTVQVAPSAHSDHAALVATIAWGTA